MNKNTDKNKLFERSKTLPKVRNLVILKTKNVVLASCVTRAIPSLTRLASRAKLDLITRRIPQLGSRSKKLKKLKSLDRD